MTSSRSVGTPLMVMVVLSLGGLTAPPADGSARPARTAAPACTAHSARSVGERDGSGAGTVALEDATDRWGLDTALRGMLAHAMAASDVNGDGWPDLFVGSFADRPLETYKVRGADGPAPDRLLLGGPHGFTVDSSFPKVFGRTSGAAFADLDRDGWPDLVVARNVRDAERGRAPSAIYRNVGGVFEQVAAIKRPLGARSIGLLDYDQDGRLDLFVTEDRWTGRSSRLLRNEGAFRFTDVTERAGLPSELVGMGVATADLNGDGAPDLFVGGSNRLFVSDGRGSFREGGSSKFSWPVFGDEDDPAGVAVGDLNRDGRPDLVIGEHYGSTIDFDREVPVRLYINEGTRDGLPQFRDVTEDAGLIGLSTKAPHVEIADFDNDGWPDILTTASVDAVTPLVFRNLGRQGTVPKFETNGKPDGTQYWPSGAVADFDRDGRLDAVLAEFDAAKPSIGTRNASDAGQWLAVGAPAGTRIDIYTAGELGNDDARIGSDTVGASTGYGSGEPLLAWFGLGETERVDVLIVLPGGASSRRRGVESGRVLVGSC